MNNFISGFFTWGKEKIENPIDLKIEKEKPKRKPKKSKFNERIALIKLQEEEENEEVVVENDNA